MSNLTVIFVALHFILDSFSSTQALTSDIDILIYVNNKRVDMKMKLAKNGDAYFYLKNLD